MMSFPTRPSAIRTGRLAASIEQFPGQQAPAGVANPRGQDSRPNAAHREIYLKPLRIDKNNLDQAEAKD